jgi:hypothetical protein
MESVFGSRRSCWPFTRQEAHCARSPASGRSRRPARRRPSSSRSRSAPRRPSRGRRSSPHSPQIPLEACAVDEFGQRQAAGCSQRAHPLGRTACGLPRRGDHGERPHVHRDLPHRLGSVRVDEDAALAAMAAISATGWMVPTSLLASMRVIRMVSGRRAAATSAARPIRRP